MTEVRPGTARDLPAVAAIQSASPEAAQWPVAAYLEYQLRVADVGGQVAGFLAGRVLAPGESEILNLAVAPERRREGVARALLNAWLAEYTGDVWLEVRESNQEARTFYQVLGFQVVGSRKEYYQAPLETAIVLKFHSC